MKPLQMTIKGIGAWRQETTIDFASLASPIAIVGSYGAGKSWLQESILFALYARGCWYAGSIYNIQTQGGDGESYIHLTFEHEGYTYRLERHINKGHSAHVYDIEWSDHILAGPKVSDVARWVEAKIGTFEIAASTWFLSQSRTSDLCGQPGEKDLVARRRAAFNELLGIEDLDAEAERMRAARASAVAQIEVLEAQLADEDATEEVEIRHETLLAARETLFAVEKLLKRAEAVAVERRQTLETWKTLAQTLVGELREVDAQIREAERVAREEAKLRERVATLRKRVDELANARAEVEALENARQCRAGLQPDLEAWEAWKNAQASYERAVAYQETLRREIDALRGSLPDAETAVLAGRQEEVEEQSRRLSLANDNATAHNEVVQKRRALLERNVATVRAEVDRLRSRIARKPVTPFGDDCAPCPLMREWAGLPEELAQEEARLEEHQWGLDALPELMEWQDANELLGLRAQVQAATQAVLRGEAAQAKINRLEAEQCEPSTPGTEPEDPRPLIADYQARIESLSSAPERLKAHGQARQDLEAALRDHAETDLAAREARKAREAAYGQKAQLEHRQATLQPQMADAEVGTTEAERQAKQARDEVQRSHADVGRAEAALEAAEVRAQAQAEKREQVQTLTVRRAALDDLVTCFGPRGVRQILVDAAAPELEDIADQLFETATEGRMRLRIATQKMLRDGSSAEDFSIMIRDQAGERDAVEHSGGELQLCSILFRISVALWIGRLRGRRPDCLFLDEAFDRLGAEGAANLLRVLNDLSDRIGLIVVVTHDPLIADRMRSQVKVTKGMSGSRIEA